MVVTTNRPDAGHTLLRCYDDGLGWPNVSRKKEQAYRQGFLEEARRVVREWAHRPEEPAVERRLPAASPSNSPAEPDFDPFGELEAARMLRLRVRKRYTVYGAAYGPGCAGRRTYHLGYRPGHEVPAARLRGRHHAMAFVAEPWDELSTDGFNTYDTLVLPAWLVAVERWAQKPIRPDRILPPPRPLEIKGIEAMPSLTIAAEITDAAEPEGNPG